MRILWFFPAAALALGLGFSACKDAGEASADKSIGDRGVEGRTGTGPRTAAAEDNTARHEVLPGDSRTGADAKSGIARANQTNTTQVGQPAAGAQPGALAGPAARQDSAAGASPGNDRIVDGTLVQAGADSILLNAPNQRGLNLKIDDSTKVTKDGKPAKASDFTEGTEVRAAYRLEGENNIAIRIEGFESSKLHPAGHTRTWTRSCARTARRGARPIRSNCAARVRLARPAFS